MRGKASVLGCEAATSLTSNVKSQATVYFLADVVHRSVGQQLGVGLRSAGPRPPPSRPSPSAIQIHTGTASLWACGARCM